MNLVEKPSSFYAMWPFLLLFICISWLIHVDNKIEKLLKTGIVKNICSYTMNIIWILFTETFVYLCNHGILYYLWSLQHNYIKTAISCIFAHLLHTVQVSRPFAPKIIRTTDPCFIRLHQKYISPPFCNNRKKNKYIIICF